eukprot:15460782-Alexandrium_andersonii.AAC.1
MTDQHLGVPLPTDPPHTATNISYVDDGLYLHLTTPTLAQNDLTDLTIIVHNAYAIHNLQLNYAPNKPPPPSPSADHTHFLPNSNSTSQTTHTYNYHKSTPHSSSPPHTFTSAPYKHHHSTHSPTPST